MSRVSFVVDVYKEKKRPNVVTYMIPAEDTSGKQRRTCFRAHTRVPLAPQGINVVDSSFFYILKKLGKNQLRIIHTIARSCYILKQLKQQPAGQFSALASDASFVEEEPRAHPVAVQVHSAILLQKKREKKSREL